MATTRRILIVDDDPELREALVEQLSLHDEFEGVSAETGAKGGNSKDRTGRSRHHGCGLARYRRPRSGENPA